ncbi:MAG TPA: VWA domain-containing protein [Acidobacteriaceae bacterium]
MPACSSRLSFRRLVVAASLSLLAFPAAAPLAAQANSSAVFRVNTRIVVLDVVVKDKKGHIVTNLKKEDFTVLEDKQPQKIRTFELPAAHVMPAATAGKAIVTSAADLPKIGDAPITLLVLDELNTQFADMAYARHELEKYLLAQPEVLKQPTALLVASNTKFQLLRDYTQNRADVLSALKKHFPEYPWKLAQSGKSGPGATERIAQSMASLLQIAEATRGTPGRKNVIWVGVNAPGVNLVGADDATIKAMGDLTRRLTQTLLADRVTLNYINPTANDSATVGVMVPGDDDDSSTMVDYDPFGADVDFNQFAPATGGQILYSRNDINNEIASTVDEGANYYTLSYSPTNPNEDAVKYRKIVIKLSDPNLTAVTREGYYPETANANNAAADVTLPADQRKRLLQLDLSQAALSTMAYNGLAITVKKSDDQKTWLISVPPSQLSWTPQPNGSSFAEVTGMSVAFDGKNKILAHSARELQSERKANQPSPETVIFQIPVDIPKGSRRLRFVIRDAVSARIGTAELAQ